MDTPGLLDDTRDDAASTPVEPADWVSTPSPGRGDSKWKRLAVGIPISFVVMSLLYGVNQVVQLIVFGTICTLGIGLILMLFACWMVGYVALEVWHAYRDKGTASTSS